MVPVSVRLFRLMVWPAAILLLCLAGQRSEAQHRKGTKQTVEEPYRQMEAEINRLVMGESPATGPAVGTAKEAAQRIAKYYVWRLTWEDQIKLNREYLPQLVKDFKNYIVEPSLKFKSKNQAFMQILDKELLATFKDEVFDKNFDEYKIEQINAGVMLPLLARYGDPEIANYLVALLKGANHDSVKLYALKAIREFYLYNPPEVANSVEGLANAVDLPRIEALLAFLQRPGPMDGVPEEIEALRFIRREAVKALAQTRVPAGLVDKKNGVKAPVAYGLLRVLASEKSGLAPAPSLSEQAEAAIGLAQINLKDFESYRPDAQTYLTGKFLLDFAMKYREDAPNLDPKNAQGRPLLLPWKTYATRLDKSLRDLQKNMKDSPSAKNLAAVLDNSLVPILEKMKRGQAIDDPAGLRGVLGRMWPKEAALPVYQGVMDIQIQMPALQKGP